MAGPVPAWWHLTALCTGESVDAIADATAVRDTLQWEGRSSDRSALVSVRYLAQSATMQDVLTQGLAALRRALCDVATTVEPTVLLREENGTVFDPENL